MQMTEKVEIVMYQWEKREILQFHSQFMIFNFSSNLSNYNVWYICLRMISCSVHKMTNMNQTSCNEEVCALQACNEEFNINDDN